MALLRLEMNSCVSLKFSDAVWLVQNVVWIKIHPFTTSTHKSMTSMCVFLIFPPPPKSLSDINIKHDVSAWPRSNINYDISGTTLTR